MQLGVAHCEVGQFAGPDVPFDQFLHRKGASGQGLEQKRAATGSGGVAQMEGTHSHELDAFCGGERAEGKAEPILRFVFSLILHFAF